KPRADLVNFASEIDDVKTERSRPGNRLCVWAGESAAASAFFCAFKALSRRCLTRKGEV
ncbi:Hypothetical predicted protein, partial [Podarcis lilfordi]